MTLTKAKKIAPNSSRKAARRMSGTRIFRCRVRARSRTGTTSPVSPKSWTLRSLALRPRVGAQIVPSAAVLFEDLGVLLLLAARSTAHMAKECQYTSPRIGTLQKLPK